MGTVPDNREEIAEDAQEAEKAATNVVKKAKRKAVFKNGTDELIYLAVFASKGASIPPLPHISKEDTDRYIESLRKDIEINKDDPPNIREMKESVNEVRKQIAGLIAQNPDSELSEILNAHRNDFNEALDLRNRAQQAYEKYVADGDAEGAAKYKEKANQFLEQYGAEPIGEDDAKEEEN